MITISEVSPDILLELNLSIGDLNGSPLCVNGMKLLEYAHLHDGIPLTKSMANFNRKCVEWAAEEFQWPGYEPRELYAVTRVLNEPDFPPLFALHSMMGNARLMRHLKGRAVLTKAGRGILGHHARLQAKMFDRAFFDSDPYGGDPRVVEAGLWDLRQILGVVGNRLAGWVSVAEFAEWCVPLDRFPTTGPLGERHNASLYVFLNAVRPLSWLGLVEAPSHRGMATALEDRQVRRTPLFDQFVRLTIPQPHSGSLH